MEALTWEAVAAIVGSIVTITIGVFGYLVKTSNQPNSESHKDHIITDINSQTIERMQVKLAAVKEKAIAVEGALDLVNAKLEAIKKQMDEHEARDIRDFNAMNTKHEKLTDVIMKILTDDKL